MTKDEVEKETVGADEPVDLAEKTVRIFGKEISRIDCFKFAGLLVFIVLIIAVFVWLWPIVSSSYKEGGLTQLSQDIQNVGPLGGLLLLALEFVQVIVAFIPGELVQAVAGALYGPLIGGVIIWLGCILASGVVFVLVQYLGKGFVQAMVSMELLERLHDFERKGRLDLAVFILFLIPGIPKDVLTYLVPLTDMKLKNFLWASGVARIPGIFATTFAADKLIEGNYLGFAIVAVIVVVIVGIVIWKRDALMDAVGKEYEEV